MLISFIVPVYNVEKYLDTCITSIVDQNYKDYEIILVDDGSTDSSSKICDRYEHQYSFIKTIHKENGGLSDARNYGIKAAQGEYILFVDSDDYIAPDAVENIVNTLKSEKNDIDVMFLEAKKFYPDNSSESLGDGMKKEYVSGKSKKEVLASIARLPKFPGSACTKLIKKELIVNQDLYFKKGLLSEDIDWTIGLLLSANTFSYCGEDYYYYRQNRMGSITNSVNKKSLDSLLYIIKKWARKDNEMPYQNDINSFLSFEYMIILYNYANLPISDQDTLKKEIDSYKWIMNYSKTRKTKIVSLCIKILGISLTSKLLNIYKK